MSKDPLLLIPFLGVLLPAAWIFSAYFVSRTGGWTRLVKLHPRPEGFWNVYERLGWRSISFGFFSNYNNCMNIALAEEGLILRPCWLFILFHPPLFLPWKDIKDAELKEGWFKGMYCRLAWGRLVIRGEAGRTVFHAWRQRNGDQASQ